MKTPACLIACAALLAPLSHAADHAYYGLLHAHTMFSDGSGTPEEAYAMAKANGLHFFAVTEHNHKDAEDGASPDRTDGVLIAKTPELYESMANDILVKPTNGPAIHAVSVQKAAEKATDQNFIALFGQEFSTISAGNHVNVLNIPKVLTNTKGDFRSLFDTVAGAIDGGTTIVVQLNHPDVHQDLFSTAPGNTNMFNDYGYDDYGKDFAQLVAGIDKYTSLIEILSGPAMAKTANPNYRYTDDHEDDYYFYLCQGLHLSPSAGQDNHYKTWGVSSSARMGVWAPALTREALYAAMKAGRTWATEDKNLALEVTANGSPMGSCLALAAGTDLVFNVTVSDADEPQASYEFTLVHGKISPQKQGSLVEVRAQDGVAGTTSRNGNGEASFEGHTTAGGPEFFYVRVKQGNSRAWSAPIWINYPRSGQPVMVADANSFVWTSNPNSHVYHQAWCSVAANISPQYRQTGTTPPANRTLHNCQPAGAAPGH